MENTGSDARPRVEYGYRNDGWICAIWQKSRKQTTKICKESKDCLKIECRDSYGLPSNKNKIFVNFENKIPAKSALEVVASVQYTAKWNENLRKVAKQRERAACACWELTWRLNVYRSTVYCTEGTTCWGPTVEGVSMTATTVLVYYWKHISSYTRTVQGCRVQSPQ
jgi:hypothetical protein